MSTALYLLRCKQNNLSFSELDEITIGMAVDMFTEQGNDSYDYPLKPTQQDFDRF